ncbi:trypsin-like peptidase domain-containing protein [Candidatus Pacearchaeota archaeon]|jgi:S1-C subfamily serine protease|nr:trypsin-like peptidase domain-containing protein [Candidatus Pacearchaeota archaeon]
MPLEKHHKIVIGGITSLLIIVLIANSIFMYWVYLKQNINYDELNSKIDSLQTDTQTKISDLSENLLDTKNDLKSLGTQIGSLDAALVKLKASASADFSGIIEDAIKSVVTIRTDISQGSGFIIASGGYVVTNAHVMEGAKAAGIITYDGKTHSVSKVGENPTMDLVLLKIVSSDYGALSLADSDSIQVGEKVIAIGNPLGLQFSVSEGIVSAIHREGENGITAYVQTDAALNPGNSGGPLINKEGKVIGMNNFKIGGSENIGFALESNYIKEIVNDISQQAYGKDLI